MTATLTAPHSPALPGHRVPLSDMQRSMLAHEALEELPIYTMPLCHDITGPLDPSLLERALHQVILRHPVLCSFYDGVEAHVLGDTAPLPPLVRLDAEAGAPAGPDEAIVPGLLRALGPVDPAEPDTAAAPGVSAALAAFWRAPFDLEREIPIRAALARVGPDRHRLALAVHHVAGDSVSLAVLLRDLGTAYRALRRDGRPPRPEPAPDFFAHARAEKAAARSGPATDWWAERLHGTAPRPFPRRVPPPESERCSRISRDLRLDADDTAGVRELARIARVSPSAVLFTAVSLATAGPGERETVIGLPTALRDRPELRSAMGPLLNTLPVRTRFGPGDAPAHAVRAHAAAIEESLTHKELPFSRIVHAAGVRRSLDAAPLFLHVVNIDHEPLRLRLDGARCTALPAPRTWVVFPAHWEFGWGVVGNMRGELRLSADAFTDAHADELTGRFREALDRLLRGVVAEPPLHDPL
ncbi:condensation domain-containing protein [Streptomyces sp. enrichment culture]|uniref:condensation domain-containing protein n=1 Tax=Streptomyces sp. enrichment culture TaxID=1795815 RepID=UPI003F547C2A